MCLKPKEKLKKKWNLTFNKNPEKTTKFRPKLCQKYIWRHSSLSIHVQSINYFLNPLSDFRFLLSSKRVSVFTLAKAYISHIFEDWYMLFIMTLGNVIFGIIEWVISWFIISYTFIESKYVSTKIIVCIRCSHVKI